MPAIRGEAGGQVFVVLIGFMYFMAGIHLDRAFLWISPFLLAGGILVGLVPHHGWTILGALIAAALLATGLIYSRIAARRVSYAE